MSIPLSILDLSPVPAGGTGADAIRDTLDLARAAEAAGYRRYWVAEHHLNSGVASSSTPVLVGLLAGATRTIRVGSGAVQMPMTPPLQVAEQFGTVAAVHPGRVDLGVGRFDIHKILALLASRNGSGGARPPAPETRVVDGLLLPTPGRVPGADLSQFAVVAARLGISVDDPVPDHRAQILEILSYLAGTARRDDGAPIHALPAEGADLQTWILGSSPGVSARTAGELSLPFAANYHTIPTTVLDTIAAYREAFVPSRTEPARERPYVMVSADVVVAPSDAAARDLAAPYGQWVLDIRTGVGARPYVTPAQAHAREWTDGERAGVADRIDTQFVGSPRTVVEGLATLARATAADELLITTITTDHADRVRSYELLADAWAAHPRALGTPAPV